MLSLQSVLAAAAASSHLAGGVSAGLLVGPRGSQSCGPYQGSATGPAAATGHACQVSPPAGHC